MRPFMLRAFCVLWLLASLCAAALGEATVTIVDPDGTETTLSLWAADDEPSDALPAPDEPAAPSAEPTARDALIDGILELAQKTYEKTGGRAQRAQYSGDIYVCKNFTVYLFRENAGRFRMAEYPDVKLVIPDNLPKAECTRSVYGVEWKTVPASQGNPFEIAAQFIYNPDKSDAENREDARALLRQAKRGDYFQMAAKYYYGVGAHSMLFSADYDPVTDTVTWCDSNMKGEKRNGERYGYVQWNANREIDWFVDAFCRSKHGATLYRLRDDIIFAP